MRRLLFLLAGPLLLGAFSIEADTCDHEVGYTAFKINAAKALPASADRATPIHFALINSAFIAACVSDPAKASQAARTANANGTSAAIIKTLETKRTDVQSGASAGAAGTTSAVASASKPNFLGLALEDGAMTKTISGTNSTISINPWKFVSSLAADQNTQIDPNDPGSKLLRRLALTTTLNTGSSSGSAGNTTGTGANATVARITAQFKQVSNVTVHLDIIK